MPPWRHTQSKRQLGSYQVKGSWWWNRGILTEVVMRCRIRAALSSTLPSLAQEHALHFQSTTPTIWRWLTLCKTTPALSGWPLHGVGGLIQGRCVWCSKEHFENVSHFTVWSLNVCDGMCLVAMLLNRIMIAVQWVTARIIYIHGYTLYIFSHINMQLT